jgi:Holliday junction resolvasome RuvABC endonuclease subunit
VDKNVLSLDLGTKTGWAIFHDTKIVSGVEDFKRKTWTRNKVKFSQGYGIIFLKFAEFLEEKHKEFKIDEVCYEKVMNHKGAYASHIYGGFEALLSYFCEENSIKYSSIPVGTIKKHCTGKGNAKKDQMIEAVKALGFNPKDDNEADAIALMRCFLGF